MFESKRLKAAFTLVTGILLGSAGTALYNDAQKDQNIRDDLRAETVARPILRLGGVDAYSSDNLPMQARISIVGLAPADIEDENNIRDAVIHTLKQQVAQKTAQQLGVDQRLDEIRSSFMAQKDRSAVPHVTIALPQKNLDDVTRSLNDTVRHTAAGKLDKDADVRLTLEVTLDPRNVERYYDRKDKQAAQGAKPSTLRAT
jgi:hypothetical protein